jgi:hypothetical protein
MKIRHLASRFFAISLFTIFTVIGLYADAQDNATPPYELTPKQQLQALMFTTPAYRKEALRLIIGEANHIAHELNLQENLPIIQSNIVETYIAPPRLAQASKNIGNITTSNYFYAVFSGGLFALTKIHSDEEFNKLKIKYTWPISQIDTNAAYQAATQFLADVAVDVKALNRDCNVHVLAMGRNGKFFVPAYRVYWVPKGQKGHGSAAGVELFEPTKILWQFYVKQPKYVLRKPIKVTNLDDLLSQTNAPTLR